MLFRKKYMQRVTYGHWAGVAYRLFKSHVDPSRVLHLQET